MKIKDNFFKSYCLILINNKESLINILDCISENNITILKGELISGDKIMVLTLKTVFNILEIENLLDTVIKSFYIFEINPDSYIAKLEGESDKKSIFFDGIDKLFPFKININPVIGDVLYENIFNKSLEEQLEESLENEDYETAAKLRDIIKNKK